jgi:putative SOS response-associated peptidase YedK
MCQRYYRRSDKQQIAEIFQVIGDLADINLPAWNFNVAPKTFQPVIRNDKETGQREMVLMRWGHVPRFVNNRETVSGFSPINTRAESILSARTWRRPFQYRRCLVPADGFYEWKKLDSKTMQPYAFDMTNHEPFAFAGLWDTWKEVGGSLLRTFVIITTEANELMSSVHTRMPVILKPADYNRWLDREVIEQPPIDLLRPFDSAAMQTSPCSPLVGNVRNNGPEMLNSEC